MPSRILLAAALLGLVAARPGEAAEDAAATPSPYKAWSRGPSSDPGYFPIAVWLQDPKRAADYKKAGINLYVGLWRGPTDEQISALKAADMPVICSHNRYGRAHEDEPIIVGWMHGDEPDNAQPVRDPKTKKQTYGPPIPPPKIVSDYQALRSADASRPILLNLGQGVANDQWKGRGPAGRLEDYHTYVKGGDIVSFDVYPVAGLEGDGTDRLWYVAKGVDRLVKWTEGKKLVWNCIEAARIDNVKAKVSPHQLRAEVWMALVHGSKGLIYFVHQFKPRSNDHALLDDPELLPAVTAVNAQIRALAPVLNGPTLADGGTVKSSVADVPIDLMVKRHAGATYAFAVGMRNAAAQGSFTLADLPGRRTAEVLGEGRRIDVVDGKFEDKFAPYDVHLYRIDPPR
jgi:hypothetical protein